MTTDALNPPTGQSFMIPGQLASEITPQSMTNGTKKQCIEDPFVSKTENGECVSGVCSLNMSRGERPEAEINWPKLENLFVYDEMGNKIKFADVYRRQKTLIIFVRHFLDFISKEYCEDIAVIPLEYLQNADVRLVVIGPAPHRFIKQFRQLTGLNHTLYVDPDREVYKALGCQEKLISGALDASKHIKSGFLSGVASSVWRAMRSSGRKEFQGDIKQQGGAFILGPGDVCHYSHIDQSSTDHCSLNDLLSAAGVMNVSFPKDPRVQEI
ncbi:thioredoxin-like protein aaed1 [Plakobranchus ocellatus]|uniref:Thioredoxin-like protein aaed1 n=1 Tax=Plakobranchus ocellatus TaxID=259542 RepID=A0AAV3ZW72_9GAST|nr:thioredoxin-like protein aaed1 [Plakobranchus ocellatus]